MSTWARPDWRRSLQLVLGTLWLLDGVLQLQPFMFTGGARGFDGTLAVTAAGNPHGIAASITWAASLIGHHSVAANAAFALIQLLLGIGIAWRPAVRMALAGSVVWSAAVWWFGEGLGGVLHGAASPIAGGPGSVLIYGVLAVLLWPPRHATTSDRPLTFAAAGGIGAPAARAVWAGLWGFLALLCLLGSGRAPQGVRDMLNGAAAGEPGWLAVIDRHTAGAAAGHGLAVAVVVAAVFAAIGAGVYLGPTVTRVTVVTALVVTLGLWVLTQNFGMILAGNATDPDTGPLLALLAVAYWPRHRPAAVPDGPVEDSSLTVEPHTELVMA